ncbi:TIGR03016 family PEP-CTERM system-associated outer membrane protein [Thiobacillus sp.]|uniref:TIGR03016 family PEP-CTERM system-associated outer membrane protein n=1 Tax=Thiobacillus sp. TaxID=924 RepID=UPI0025E56E66|nr:TIGR03016 family PEP-CTERM system-associated outer membrane protein [Thiobacillus sp.]MBT9538611.1 TIGR03016 family PEP-CTERM system-associated outer membrane protein [Thiobacillus sp.]
MVTMAVTVNKVRSCSFMPALQRRMLLAAALLVVITLPASPVVAMDWQFEPSVGGTATYTDNANQSGVNPEDALIFTVRPSFSLRSEGSRRIQASLGYSLSGVARYGEDQSTDLNHNLGALGKAELVEDFLFIDGTASISQELISLTGSPADANINDSNRAAVGTYSISPYIKKRLGTFADAQVRYTTGGAIFENDVASNSNINALTAELTNGTHFNNLSWEINYSLRKANNSTTADTTFERVSASAGYAFTRKFRVFGTVGQDWNDYLSTSGTSGSSWSTGVGWSPTSRTSVEASFGERYFGNTYSLSASHRTRISRWTASYSENVSDITQQFLEESGRVFWVCNRILRETPDINPPQDPCPTGWVGPISAGRLAFELNNLGISIDDLVAANLLNISIANGVYVIKSFAAGVSWDVGRLGFGLSARDIKRLYQALSDAQDHVQGLTGSVNYRMSPRTNAYSSLSLTWNNVDALLAGGTAREDELLSFNLGFNHRFAERLNGALTLRHTQRDSNDANADYDENSITASVNLSF